MAAEVTCGTAPEAPDAAAATCVRDEVLVSYPCSVW